MLKLKLIYPLPFIPLLRRFWPVIDDRLRRAAYERGVSVRVMASHWNHTRPDMADWLLSLQALSSPRTRMDLQAVSCMKILLINKEY